MFNDHLSGEEVKEHIKQLLRDAESDRVLKNSGYGSGAARWALAVVILLVVAALLN